MTPLPAPASPASPPLLAWQGGGLQLRGPVSGVFLYPTVILFAEGAAGIATAKALIQATSHAGGLSFKRRTDVRMYYRVGAAAAAAAAATAASQCCSLYAPCFEWVAVLCLALSSLLLSPTQSAHAHPCTHRCPAAPPPPPPCPPFPPPPQAPNEASLCYREQYDEWAEQYGVQVITSTRDSFADMFDDDQTLM